MYKGIVKFFDSRDGKQYGFLVVDDELADGTPSYRGGEEIFFHFNDGEFIVAGGKEPRFNGQHKRQTSQGTRVLRIPEKDDVIVFSTRSGRDNRIKASPWSFLSLYERAAKAIAERPVYRVLEGSGDWGKSPSPEKPDGARIKWQGSDLEALMKLFPIPVGRSPSADPLLSFWSSDDGFEVRRWWEKQNVDGSWTQCPDPRSLPGVLRQFERISNRW